MYRIFLLAIMLVMSVSASVSANKSWAANLTSEALSTFGKDARLEYSVISNFGKEGEFQAAIHLHNTSDVTLPAGVSNWKIYIHSVRRILATDNKDFTIKRIQGDLHEVAPTTAFKGLKPGESLQIHYRARAHISSYSDFMPRAFIALADGSSAVFANTDTEDLTAFVRPFTRPEQYLRFDQPEDQYGVVTSTSRYQANLAINNQDAPGSVRRIIPTPKTIKYSSGETRVDNRWSIVEQGGLRFEVDYLHARLADAGIQVSISPSVKKERQIELNLGAASDVDGAYELDITGSRIVISARDSRGIFYGIQSLMSLFPAEQKAQHALPAVRVFDEPRYDWRGMHYDIARNFHGKQAILSLIEQMGRYKLNKLHLHLTDDEGWRIEIPGLPELTEVGAHRCFDLAEEKCLLTQLGNGPDAQAAGNGFLTTADFVEIIRFAAQRHIEVIPEIDMPGHARAAVKAMEARYKKLKRAGKVEAAQQYLLSDPDDKSQYLTVQSYSDNAINVCLPSTYHFAEKVIYELQQMYRAAGQKLAIFHMGGDEVGVGSWTQSPACQAMFASNDTEVMGVADLKPYFVRKLSQITSKRGLELAGWEDGLMYDPNNVFVRERLENRQVIANAWDNIWESGLSDRAYRLANAGYGVVISSATHLYFDHPYEAHAGERGYHWATRYTDLSKVFGFMPDNLYANADKTFTGAAIDNLDALVGRVHVPLKKPENILGMQGQLWSETVRTAAQFQEMIFPRLLVMAERAWYKAPWESDKPDGVARREEWRQFVHMLVKKELPKLDHAGVDFYLPPPGAVREKGLLLANTSLPGLVIEYSLDGGKQWQAYPQYLELEQGVANILMRSRLGEKTSRVIQVE